MKQFKTSQSLKRKKNDCDYDDDDDGDDESDVCTRDRVFGG